MKLLHLSDLHIGKRVNGYSMLDEQEYILNKIIQITDEEKPDGILIAGDVYDKTVPSTQAVTLFDDFLVKLSKMNQQVFIISGNHDSPERLAFANRLLDMSGIHISSIYDGKPESFTLKKEDEKVNIFLLPFIRPINVKRFFPEEEIDDYTDCIRVAVNNMNINTEEINICVSHQFVTGSIRSGSEENAGGLENVDSDVYDVFDYVALGHIHGVNNMSDGKIRYCGSPLKYSFSEKNHTKSITIVEINGKESINIRTIDLIPKTDMIEIRGSYEEITRRDYYEGKPFRDAYLHIVLTDENDILNAASILHIIYPNLMSIEYDNARTRNYQAVTIANQVEKKTPQQLFGELFELRNNASMSDEQKKYINELVDRVWRDTK